MNVDVESMVLLITSFFSTYGLALGFLALSSIIVLGVLKFFKVFDRVSDDYKKHIYISMATLLCALASLIYLLAVGSFDWELWISMTCVVWGANQAMYSVYENAGIRTLVKKIGTYILTTVASSQIAELASKLNAAAEETETVVVDDDEVID